MSSRVTHVPLESVRQRLPTSGLGSSRSVLLGCMFCAMTMRARRSEVVSVLAFRLQGAAERRAKHLFRKRRAKLSESPVRHFTFTFTFHQGLHWSSHA